MKVLDKLTHDRLLSMVLRVIVLGSFLVFPAYKSHAKIQLPAGITLELAEPTTPGQPLIFLVTVTSKIPLSTGSVTLTIPPIGTEPSHNIVLWSGSADAPTTRSLEYTIPALPTGKYEFRVSFQLTPTSEGAGTIRVGQNLYVDARTTSILSSNVSFTQIRRLELKNELERRGLSTMPETQQKALAPDLKRQIEELGRLEIVTPPSRDDAGPEKITPGLQKAPIQGTKNAVPGSVGTGVPKDVVPSAAVKAPLEGSKVGVPGPAPINDPKKISPGL